jgi:hypothetical protein
MQRRFGGVQGGIDMTHGAIAQVTSDRIILFTRHVRVHLAQQLHGLVQFARTVARHIGSRMVFYVLPVVDRSVFDFANRRVNFGDRHRAVRRSVSACK